MDKKNLKKNYHNNISILSANGEMNLSILYIYIYICFFLVSIRMVALDKRLCVLHRCFFQLKGCYLGHRFL